MSHNDRSKMKLGDPDRAEFSLCVIENSHFRQMCYMAVRDPRIPSSYENAILIPMWAKAIYIGMFHNCLIMTIFEVQYLVPMKWTFSIKSDGNQEAHLVATRQPEGDLLWKQNRRSYCDFLQATNVGR